MWVARRDVMKVGVVQDGLEECATAHEVAELERAESVAMVGHLARDKVAPRRLAVLNVELRRKLDAALERLAAAAVEEHALERAHGRRRRRDVRRELVRELLGDARPKLARLGERDLCPP